ncbi:DUF6261 family protein [Porphyromonas loveana]|uniref:DUF6261 family protein n=1 Tax=Porphyromonas loveana TaxID=1884669 RepID=UPI00359F849D
MKTKALTKRLLRNLEHYQFAKNVLTLCRQANIAKVNAVLPPLEKAIAEEDRLLNVERKEIGTQELAQLDNDRDNAWRAISLQVQAALLSDKAEIVRAARMIGNVLARYPKLISLVYSQETGGIENLITDLRDKAVSPAVEKLGLKAGVDRLEKLNKAFDALYLERLKVLPHQSGMDIRQLRAATDEAINGITRRMDALLELERTNAIEELVRLYNNLVEKKLRDLARRIAYGKAATEKRRAEIEKMLQPMMERIVSEEKKTSAVFAGRTLGIGKARHYLITLTDANGDEEDRWYRIEEGLLFFVPEDQLPKPKKKKKTTSEPSETPESPSIPTPSPGGDSGEQGSIGGGL